MPPGDTAVCERERKIAIDSQAVEQPADRDPPSASER